jgi:uncharacterized protein involved in cysteine biosynthesis
MFVFSASFGSTKTLANVLQASKISLTYFSPPADKTRDAFQHMKTKLRR